MIDMTGTAADQLHADLAAERDAPHPRPHPGCTRCDPAIVASRRAHVAGIRRTRAQGTPNRIRVVAIAEGGPLLVVPGRGT